MGIPALTLCNPQKFVVGRLTGMRIDPEREPTISLTTAFAVLI
jgi:hypothetical protein